jgi:hypothetical protein
MLRDQRAHQGGMQEDHEFYAPFGELGGERCALTCDGIFAVGHGCCRAISAGSTA